MALLYTLNHITRKGIYHLIWLTGVSLGLFEGIMFRTFGENLAASACLSGRLIRTIALEEPLVERGNGPHQKVQKFWKNLTLRNESVQYSLQCSHNILLVHSFVYLRQKISKF